MDRCGIEQEMMIVDTIAMHGSSESCTRDGDTCFGSGSIIVIEQEILES